MLAVAYSARASTIGKRDAQLAGVGRDLRQPWSRRRRCKIGITRRGACRRVEDGRRVAHCDRDRVFGNRSARAFTQPRRKAVAPARGFQADQPATGGRHADRTEPVTGMGRGQNARRHGRSGTARRPARCHLVVPGVLRRAVELRLACDRHTEFAGVRLAEDRHTGRLEALDGLAIEIRDNVGHELTAAGSRRSGDGGPEVLDQVRDPRNRAFGQFGAREIASHVIEFLHHGIERGIARLATSNRGFHQL